MHAAYAVLTAVINAPLTLVVIAVLALGAIKPLVLFDDRQRLKRRANTR